MRGKLCVLGTQGCKSETYQQLSVIIGIKALVVKESLEQAKKSLAVNEKLAQIVKS